MASISKHKDSSTKSHVDDGIDRISGLPEAILVHILSFLPTKYAVATSKVSPRWRYLWASVPNLDFDDEYCVLLCDPARCEIRPFSLLNFVDKVLLLHDLTSLSKFCFKSVGDIDMYRLNTWISTVVKRFIEEIHVCIFYDYHVNLPHSLFTSKTLVVLELGYKLSIIFPTSIWFPSLKILDLSISDLDDNMMQKLFLSCPVLENLVIEAFVGRNGELVLNVTIPSLKRLRIILEPNTIPYCDYKIVIDAPSLEFISLHDDLLACYSWKNMPSLLKAIVYVGECSFEDENHDHDVRDWDHANRIYTIFEGLSNTKSLWLSYYIMETLNLADDCNLCMFYNLTRLEVFIRFRHGSTQLLNLLKSMPNLERLEIHNVCPPSSLTNNSDSESEEEEEEEEEEKVQKEDDAEEEEEESTFGAAQEVPSCLLSHLKEIKLIDFEGHKNEMILVKYFLKNAEVLQKVTVGCCYRMPETEKRKSWQELSSFPKGSKTCQVEFPQN